MEYKYTRVIAMFNSSMLASHVKNNIHLMTSTIVTIILATDTQHEQQQEQQQEQQYKQQITLTITTLATTTLRATLANSSQHCVSYSLQVLWPILNLGSGRTGDKAAPGGIFSWPVGPLSFQTLFPNATLSLKLLWPLIRVGILAYTFKTDMLIYQI